MASTGVDRRFYQSCVQRSKEFLDTMAHTKGRSCSHAVGERERLLLVRKEGMRKSNSMID